MTYDPSCNWLMAHEMYKQYAQDAIRNGRSHHGMTASLEDGQGAITKLKVTAQPSLPAALMVVAGVPEDEPRMVRDGCSPYAVGDMLPAQSTAAHCAFNGHLLLPDCLYDHTQLLCEGYDLVYSLCYVHAVPEKVLPRCSGPHFMPRSGQDVYLIYLDAVRDVVLGSSDADRRPRFGALLPIYLL